MSRHFAARAAGKLGLKPCAPDDADIALLLAYPWPGNVRELASVMERAAILGNGARWEVGTALGAGAAASAPASISVATPQQSGMIVSRFPSLDEAMAAHIQSALRHSNGRVEGPHGAARLLGVNPHTLRSRMRKLGIDWQTFREQAAPAGG